MGLKREPICRGGVIGLAWAEGDDSPKSGPTNLKVPEDPGLPPTELILSGDDGNDPNLIKGLSAVADELSGEAGLNSAGLSDPASCDSTA